MFYCRKKRFKIFVFLLFSMYIWYIHRKQKVLVSFSPSYVVACKGNNIKLYSQVRGSSIPGEPNIMLTDTSIEKAKHFLRNSENQGSSMSNHYAVAEIWNDICGTEIKNLIYYPLFPDLPSVRKRLDFLQMPLIESNAGIRIFGFIVPKKTGAYIFELTLCAVNAEVWLSASAAPQESLRIIESVISNREPVFFSSKPVTLVNNERYYFDIVLKSGDKPGSFSLQWKKLLSAAEPIDGKYLLPYSPDIPGSDDTVILGNKLPDNTALLMGRKTWSDSYEYSTQKQKAIYFYPFMDEEDSKELFPECEYRPSYLIKKLKYRFQGVWETHLTSVYPDDFTDIPYKLKRSGFHQVIFGNPVLDKNVADTVVSKVVDAIHRKHLRKYQLVSILNVEENADEMEGKRYLVELELSMTNSQENVRFSEYVYLPSSTQSLCYPKDFKWKKNAEVNVIVTIGRQGRWAKHFIDTMSRIYNDTLDRNLNVIIVDFDSTDIDIAQALKESSLPRYTLLKRSGKFHKTEAIQAAVNTIDDPDAITLQLDLHLIIPSDLIDNVRKHTVQGKMTYSPILARLQCGAHPHEPYGFWEISGYGIFGIFKSDWGIIGGMDTQMFQDKWGSEDWDLLDRVLERGYEVERLKVKNFYHVFHSKKKMWQDMEYVISLKADLQPVK